MGNPSPFQRLSIFSILGPERAKKLSIGVHGFAENRENRQPLFRERIKVRVTSEVERDEARSDFLRKQGYEVLRFRDHEEFLETEVVLQRIADLLAAHGIE